MNTNKNHKFTGGGVPYGYIIDSSGIFAVDENKAAVVREIFQSRAAGRSLQQICDKLNKKGVKTGRGSDFTKQGIKYILGNRAYAGEYCSNGSGKIPKIVSKQLYNKINAVKEPGVVQEQENKSDLFFNSAFIFDPAFGFNNR